MDTVKVPVHALQVVIAALTSSGPEVRELQATRGLPFNSENEDGNPIDIIVEAMNSVLANNLITGSEEPGNKDNTELIKEIEDLRYMLFIEHMRSGHGIYTDDGQLQCSVCMVDFINQSPTEIRDLITKNNKKEALIGMREKYGSEHSDEELYDMAVKEATSQ